MARPSKPVKVIEMEGRSHRTKAELESRRKAEEELLSGTPMKERPEVKADPVAHKEYRKLVRLLRQMGMDDDIYGAVINRYCVLTSECLAMQERITGLYEGGEYNAASKMEDQLHRKRTMLLQIEKENVMTVQAALRAVPKQPKAEEEDDPMASLLAKRS